MVCNWPGTVYSHMYGWPGTVYSHMYGWLGTVYMCARMQLAGCADVCQLLSLTSLQGRNPFYLEPTVIVVITDGHCFTSEESVQDEVIDFSM